VSFVNTGAGAARNLCMGVNGSTFPARAQVHEVCHSLRCHDAYVAVAFHLKFIGGILYTLETKVNVWAVYYGLMHWQCAIARQVLYDLCVCEWGVVTKWRGENRGYWWRYWWHFGTWIVAMESAGWGTGWGLYWSPSGYSCVINTTTVCWTSSHAHFKTPRRLHNDIYGLIGTVL